MFEAAAVHTFVFRQTGACFPIVAAPTASSNCFYMVILSVIRLSVMLDGD